MKTLATSRSVRGFSLLEVLVAIVILSVGLLALASLQLTLIRASNDTKAQTTAMSLAKEKIETLGSYEIMGGASACYSPAATAVSGQDSCYRQINVQSGEAINGIGGIDYTRATAVTRYIYRTSTSTFVDTTTGLFTNVMLDTGVKTACPTCLPGKEFKRVAVTVSWTDAGGISRNVQVEDVIPGLSPADSLAVSSIDELTTPRKPTVIITNPASEAGVIPIAIGDGSDTAATNPRPVIVSQGNSTQTTEVRYDVYTYAALSGDAATAQSRVETAFIGCRCVYGTGTATAAFRPTYWNGFLFKAPTTVSNIPVSTASTGNQVNQSEKCTACCRDHHDTLTSVAPLYDPRRTTHNHYLSTNLNSVVAESNGNQYDEACRLIRVDGVFRVAAEPYVDHYGLLATVGIVGSFATTDIEDAVPGEGAGSMSEFYATFVTNYLNDRYVDATAYNTVLDPTTVTGYSDLQAPSSASIAQSSSPQYMHSRGLQIEHLHTDAIAAIASAKAACIAASCTDAQTQTAIFKRLFFTTVPATELATWATSNVSKVTVSNLSGVGDLSATLDAPMPISGKATFASGTTGQTVTMTSSFQRSSAGQALTDRVFPDSELTDNVLSDTQVFAIGTGGSGSFPGGEIVTVSMSGGTGFSTILDNNGGNIPQVRFGPAFLSCNPDISDNNPSPWTCVTDTTFGLGGTIAFKLSNYNRSSNVNVQNSCTQGNQTSQQNDETAMPYRREFDVASAVSGASTISAFTVVNADALPEETSFTVNPVAAGATVAVTYSAVTYLCPANWASYISNSGNEASPLPTNSGPSSICTNGNPKTPQWDIGSAFIACPNGMSPFNGN